MPFVTPTLSDAFGSRFGTTAITGSLNPVNNGGVFNVGADIGAGPPFGAITTTNSWGFDAGRAPAGTTSLIVSANGMTRELAQTFTFGGFASADAELSITIEEFVRVRVPRAPASLTRVRSFNSNRMPFIHIWSGGAGLQIHDRKAPFFPVMLIPITTGRFLPMLVQRHPVSDVPSGDRPGGRELHLLLRLYHGVLCLQLSLREASEPTRRRAWAQRVGGHEAEFCGSAEEAPPDSRTLLPSMRTERQPRQASPALAGSIGARRA